MIQFNIPTPHKSVESVVLIARRAYRSESGHQHSVGAADDVALVIKEEWLDLILRGIATLSWLKTRSAVDAAVGMSLHQQRSHESDSIITCLPTMAEQLCTGDISCLPGNCGIYVRVQEEQAQRTARYARCRGRRRRRRRRGRRLP